MVDTCKKSVNEMEEPLTQDSVRTMLGVYMGNTPSDVAVFEAWLGRPVDDYVDIIGMDIYDETIWCNIEDPAARWAYNLTEPYGLNWHRDFAAMHKKPMSYPEWGVGGNGSGDNPYFIEKMQTWFQMNKVIYQTYWNSNAAYPGKLSDNQYPNAANKYREIFGNIE
jgi:hypothetical protein